MFVFQYHKKFKACKHLWPVSNNKILKILGICLIRIQNKSKEIEKNLIKKKNKKLIKTSQNK